MPLSFRAFVTVNVKVASAIVGAGERRMVRGHRRDRPADADLTPNGIVRDAQATSQLIKSEIFIVRQNYDRTGEHSDQQPDTAALLDHQPVPPRKHEGRFDGRSF